MSKEASDIGHPLTGRHFEDQLLLAIIDAYPDPSLSEFQWERKRERRLAAAKSALFNFSSRRGQVEYNDEKALFYMAQHYLKDMGDKAKKRRSHRKLAEEASKLTAGTSKSAIIDRLRKAFENRKDDLVAVLNVHDFVPESQERLVLRNIFETLNRHGIQTKFIP